MATPILPLLAHPVAGARLRRGFDNGVVRTEEGCWRWIKTTRKEGYGQVSASKNVKISAHRLSYALHYGVDPGDSFVCHRCDNPECTNPAHLFLADADGNNSDKIEKGRAALQDEESNGNAKLSVYAVAAVLHMIELGHNNKAIAAVFGVTHSAVSRIRRRQAWADHPVRAYAPA